ncbi:hypothetical protein BD779DRAFT_1477686 [Infundibulicybe gibba]|nr:hypothetical protein BD779DRAFT_1477686 [Infundibulicybe gibba]
MLASTRRMVRAHIIAILADTENGTCVPYLRIWWAPTVFISSEKTIWCTTDSFLRKRLWLKRRSGYEERRVCATISTAPALFASSSSLSASSSGLVPPTYLLWASSTVLSPLRSFQHFLPTCFEVPDMKIFAETKIFALRPYKKDWSTPLLRLRVRGAILWHRHRLEMPDEEYSWVIMGTRHPSRSDARKHWTIRGFVGGRGISTMHVYLWGSVFYSNGGRWERVKEPFDPEQRGLRL